MCGHAHGGQDSRHPFRRCPGVILDIQEEPGVEAQELDTVGMPEGVMYEEGWSSGGPVGREVGWNSNLCDT